MFRVPLVQRTTPYIIRFTEDLPNPLYRRNLSQIRLVGIDLMTERVMVARHQTAAHNQRIGFATADACQLPFRDGVFDSCQRRGLTRISTTDSDSIDTPFTVPGVYSQNRVAASSRVS